MSGFSVRQTKISTSGLVPQSNVNASRVTQQSQRIYCTPQAPLQYRDLQSSQTVSSSQPIIHQQAILNPYFSGISGVFLDQCNQQLNNSGVSNVPKTPQQKANVAKMQQIMNKLITPQRHIHQIIGGNSMVRSGIQAVVGEDTTMNNITIIKDYAIPIIQELIYQDAEYNRCQLSGSPDYLISVQQNEKGEFPVGLISKVQSEVGARPFAKSRNSARAVPRIPLSVSDRLIQRDVIKGVDYIHQVFYRETCQLETQFLASSLFHRILSKVQLRKSELKLLSGVCIFMAAKLEENYGEMIAESSSYVVKYFGDIFTESEMYHAEMKVCDALDWRLGVSHINPRVYLKCLFRDLGLSLKTCLLASFLAEITTLDQAFLKFTSFEVAQACVEVAIVAQIRQKFDSDFQQHSVVSKMFITLAASNAQNTTDQSLQKIGYKNTKDIGECRRFIVAFWKEIITNFQATQVFKKYSEQTYFRLAQVVAPIKDIDLELSNFFQ